MTGTVHTVGSSAHSWQQCETGSSAFLRFYGKTYGVHVVDSYNSTQGTECCVSMATNVKERAALLGDTWSALLLLSSGHEYFVSITVKQSAAVLSRVSQQRFCHV